MQNMTLENIAIASIGTYYGDEDLKKNIVKGITIDSREVKEEYLFIPVKGEKVDGHDYIASAFKKGALCVLSEKILSKDYEPYILVESTLQAIKSIAEFYRENLNIKVIGITGSVGKTSTKEIIASVLSQKYNVLKTNGNFNNEIGLPLTIFRIREEHEIAVLEMGISDFGEMHRLSKVAKPDIGLITNIGPCHLENLNNREGVLKAKTELFDYISDNGSIVINGDDDLLSTIEVIGNIEPVRYGLDKNKNNIYAENIVKNGLNGISCDIKFEDKNISVNIPIPGEHMIYNALAATAIGYILKLSNEQIKNGIESVQSVSGRVNIIKTEILTIIDDCYNANPVSMKASLDVLSGDQNRKVCILGDMGELGECSEQLHFDIGKYAAEKEIDCIICIGKLSRNMFEGAKSKSKQTGIYYFESKKEFSTKINYLINNNDTILVKASHFMNFETLVKELQLIQNLPV